MARRFAACRLDPPCGFRSAAIDALEGAARPTGIAADKPEPLRASRRGPGGIAVTARTLRWAHSGIVEAPRDMNLPALPIAEFAIRLRPQAGRAAADLAQLLNDGLALA